MINNIQAIEIQPGLNGLTSGTHKGIMLIHCVAAGDVTIAFDSGNETVSLTAGDDRSVRGLDVSIVSGTFDLNK